MNKETIGIIKGTTKCSMGHQPHTTGSGAHKDKRTKRVRTRSAKTRSAIKEYSL